MEAFYSKVRRLKDTHGIKAEELTHKIFHDYTYIHRKLKKAMKTKFQNRTGVEFDEWVVRLNAQFGETLVKEIISDDEFWGILTQLS